jgi:putative addiction module killer protein
LKKRANELVVKCWVGPRDDKPVRDWIAELDNQSFKQLDKLLAMLRQEMKNLGMPYVRHLGDGLFELRDQRQSGPGYRLYYCWEGDLVVILLIGGDKDSQDNDIQTARRRMNLEKE